MNRPQKAIVSPVRSASNLLRTVAPDASITPRAQPLLGIFNGEGCGPELIRATLRVLDALEQATGLRTERRFGGAIGLKAPGAINGTLTPETIAFCDGVFAAGGAVFSGAAGGRFVYDLRRHYDLYCKIAPLQPDAVLRHANRLRPETLEGIDILVVRDNAGGIYQGSACDSIDAAAGWVAEQSFSYSEKQVASIVSAGARIAALRRKHMHVVIKDGGVPTISEVWRQVSLRTAAQYGVQLHLINADHAAYRLMQHPQEFDVLVTPNMVGDILADLGAVLLGSRGLSYSGNFSPCGRAVYQTGHGAAYDLQGTDRVNPVAQLLALAMLLRISFDRIAEADLLERAITAVWETGVRTDDLAEPGCRIVGTQALADLIAQKVLELSATAVVL